MISTGKSERAAVIALWIRSREIWLEPTILSSLRGPVGRLSVDGGLVALGVPLERSSSDPDPPWMVKYLGILVVMVPPKWLGRGRYGSLREIVNRKVWV